MSKIMQRRDSRNNNNNNNNNNKVKMGIRRVRLVLVLSLLLSYYQDKGKGGVHGLYFSFPTFHPNTSTAGVIRLTNDASIASDSTYISLTNTSQYSMGRTLFATPIPLWTNTTAANANTNTTTTTTTLASFATSFQFRILNTTTDFGDGMAFLMCGTLSPAPGGSEGGNLGILDHDRNGSASNYIIAVEFDTFRNDPLYIVDIDNNHVGINVNSYDSVVSRSLDDLRMDLKSGAVLMSWVQYDGLSKLLSVYISTEPFFDISTLASNPFLTHKIDLSQFLPSYMYVGFSAATGSNIELHEILSWEFNSTSPVPNYGPSPAEESKFSGGVITAVVLSAIFLLFLLPSVFYLIFRQRKKRSTSTSLGDAELAQKCAGPRRFRYKEIKHATENFCQENYLGRGGFGPVHKRILPRIGTDVAVKSVGHNSKQGEREFLAEVTIISRIHHRNLLHLQGWCQHKGKLFLVYDFMPNGSLDRHLFNQEYKPGLDWTQRHKIVCGLAAGLLYLHEECDKQVIHRDVKSANVMLDQDFNARLGDFGMARLVDHDQMLPTTRAVGTFGYIAPELVQGGKATSASDVYAFGAVALEVACGRPVLHNNPPPSQANLVEWVWELYSRDVHLEAVDPHLGNEFEKEQMEKVLKLGLACSHPDPQSRPTMRQVHDCLNNVIPTPPIPKSRPMVVSSYNTFSPSSPSTSQFPTPTQTSRLLALWINAFFPSPALTRVPTTQIDNEITTTASIISI